MSWNFHVAFKESNSQSQMYHILECFSFDRNGEENTTWIPLNAHLGTASALIWNRPYKNKNIKVVLWLMNVKHFLFQVTLLNMT